MRILFFLAILMLSGHLAAQRPTASLTGELVYPKRFTAQEEAEITRRLENMDCLIGNKNHPVVHSYIRGYMLRNREKSEIILGRIPSYFPLFEEELRKAGLPTELKYLAIVESALDPRALSRAGAGGLWQFMPGTGKMFKLRINNTVDERGDPLKATRAAIQFLKEEYQRFGSWELVLAAYNGGPGRVKRAIRRAGSKDFWKIRKYLPRETRNYVPAFVAATYLHKYGRAHYLNPVKMSLDEEHPEVVAVPQGVSLREIAQATGLSLDLVKALNPHCLKGYVPASADATCRVPARTAETLRTYLRYRSDGSNPEYVTEVRQRPLLQGGIPNNDHHYEAVTRTLPARTHAAAFAREHGTSLYHLQSWNPQLSEYSSVDQQVVTYHQRHSRAARRAARRRWSAAPLPVRELTTFAIGTHHVKVPAQTAVIPTKRYTLQRYETLYDVWQLHAADLDWAAFLRWNDIEHPAQVQPGTELLILD